MIETTKTIPAVVEGEMPSFKHQISAEDSQRRRICWLRYLVPVDEDREKIYHLRYRISERDIFRLKDYKGPYPAEVMLVHDNPVPTKEWVRYAASQFQDEKMALQLFTATREGMKRSRWYYDDPSDKESLYLKRYLAWMRISAKIIEQSRDRLIGRLAGSRAGGRDPG